MNPRAVSWANTGLGVVFGAVGMAAIALHQWLDGAAWLCVGSLLVLFGTADQARPLPRWKVAVAIALPVIGACLLLAHLLALGQGW
jgi:hypothetical protein